jgi:hypothetical protein
MFLRSLPASLLLLLAMPLVACGAADGGDADVGASESQLKPPSPVSATVADIASIYVGAHAHETFKPKDAQRPYDRYELSSDGAFTDALITLGARNDQSLIQLLDRDGNDTGKAVTSVVDVPRNEQTNDEYLNAESNPAAVETTFPKIGVYLSIKHHDRLGSMIGTSADATTYVFEKGEIAVQISAAREGRGKTMRATVTALCGSGDSVGCDQSGLKNLDTRAAASKRQLEICWDIGTRVGCN